jgi:hypothetical protein
MLLGGPSLPFEYAVWEQVREQKRRASHCALLSLSGSAKMRLHSSQDLVDPAFVMTRLR